MGTDNFGRDTFSAVVQGARTSMTVVLGVVAIAVVVGTLVGTVAGYRRGFLDDLLMRLAELFQSVPRFFLALLVLSLFGASTLNLVLMLGLTSWPMLARVTRAEALSLRSRDFVEASRATGASIGRIVGRHIVPNIMPSALVVAALLASRVILIEASLRYLGLADTDSVSWGSLAREGQVYVHTAWWMAVFPGLAIIAAVLGINLLADAANSVFDPLRRSNQVVRHSATAPSADILGVGAR